MALPLKIDKRSDNNEEEVVVDNNEVEVVEENNEVEVMFSINSYNLSDKEDKNSEKNAEETGIIKYDDSNIELIED